MTGSRSALLEIGSARQSAERPQGHEESHPDRSGGRHGAHREYSPGRTRGGGHRAQHDAGYPNRLPDGYRRGQEEYYHRTWGTSGGPSVRSHILTIDPEQDNPDDPRANALLTREYRKGFEVPTKLE
jgi:hypothetical protein